MKNLKLTVKTLKELDNKDLNRVVGGSGDKLTGAGSGKTCPGSSGL